jgi:Tol biopolymer transport system component
MLARLRPSPAILVACLVVPAALAGVAFAAPAAQTKRVSVNSTGAQANGASYSPGISANGRLVVFSSSASDLVSGDTNGARDIFVRDTQTHKTNRVSVSSGGAEANGSSFASPATISSDGRYVAFASDATNLVTGDTNATTDIFVRDLKLHKTKRVSVSSTGAQGDAASSSHPIISGDGGSVIFESGATNLVAGDTNGQQDVFVRNLKTHTTRRVSISSTGTQSNGTSLESSISADGHVVGFTSYATNLVPGDANANTDVFVRDLKTQKTRLVSVSSSGVRGDAFSSEPSISADGRYVGFESGSTNLVSGDTNGVPDIFLRDLKAHKTKRVSVSSSGTQGNGFSFFIDPAVSAHGEFVVFVSQASNLVPGDTNASGDDFIRDVANHKTRRLSVSSAGAQGNGYSLDPAITPDGRFVAFQSNASNLVDGDTNAQPDVFVRGPLQP